MAEANDSPVVAPSEPLSLDQQFEKENAEIEELLKSQGVDETGEAEQVPEPEARSEELALSEETPAPEPAPTDTPPAEEIPPAEQTPEPEPLPRDAKDKPRPWAEKRAAQKKLAETERELAEYKQREAERLAAEKGDAPEPEFEDPLEKIQKDQKRLEETLQQQVEENRRRAVEQRITQDEERFSRDNPDYKDALNYIGQRARQRFELTGELEDKTQEVLEKFTDQLEGIMRNMGISEPTEADAERVAKDCAFALLFEQERQRFVSRHVAKGLSVAEAAYKLAQAEGYQKPDAAAPAPAPVPAKPALTAQQKVQQQAKIAVAGQTLSAMQNAGPAKGIEVRTKAEFMRLTPKEQDIFTEQMEEINPNWLQEMPE